MKIFKKLRKKIKNKNSNIFEANEDGSDIANTERQRRKRRIKKKVKSTIGVLLFCLLAIGGMYKNITEVKAANFASKVVNIGGPITLEGNYTVTVWRSGNTVYCKAHVYVAAPNGAWSAMGAQVSANKGSASNTFVGNGSATPKAGSGDVQFSFTDAGAGTVSGTIYAGFMPNLNGVQALTASFSVNYSSNTVNTHTVTYDTNGGYYKEPYKNSEGRIIIPDGNYTLQHVWSKKNKNLNQYMTIKNGNMSSGTGMVITKNDPSSAQSQWTFERYKDTSYYYIINVKSGKAIGLNGYPQNGSLRDKAVEMYNQTLNEDDYLWYLREDGPGEYYIINKHTRQGLTARYTTVGDGNLIFQYGEGNDTSENTIYGDSTWYFNKVGEEVRTKAEGATFFTKSSIPVRTGYTFKYWSSSKDFATTWDGKNWDFNSTILDRAYIRAIGHNKYEVLAHTNGSIGEVSAPTWTMDGNQSDIVWYKLYPGTWERDGHTYNWGVQVTHKGEFAGTPLVTHFYSYYSNGSGQAAAREYGRVPRIFMSEGSYTYDQNGGNAILYANWYPKTVKTTFHRNFNSSDTTTATHTYTAGAGQSFSTNGWSRQGYTLLGWSHSSNAKTATYTPTNGIGDGWIEVYSGSTDLYAVWKKNSYQQTVRVRFENADGSFTGYSQAYQANHAKDSLFEWEFPASQQYQSAKVSYKVTGPKSTDVTVYRKKCTVKALARYQNKDGSWPSEYKEEYNKTYRYGEECPDYPKFVNTASDYNGIVSWRAFTVTEDKVMKFDLALDKGSVTVKVYLNGVRKELNNDYFKFDYYVENKLVASQVNSVEDKKSFYKSNFVIKNITPIRGYHYDNKYIQKSWFGMHPVENNTGIIDGVLNKDTGNEYILYISANQYTVTYNANKGSGSMSPDTVTYNTAYKTKKNTFTRTGYTFTGWNEKADGTGTAWSLSSSGVYEANKTWTWAYTHDITLYAQWKPNNYTYNIKYVSSSGKDLGHDTVTGAFDTSKTVTPPNKAGYTTPAAQTVTFNSTTAKTITFVYPLINYSISYDVNGGTALSSPRTSYNVESSAYTLPVTSRTGYTFTGWTGSNGTTPQKSVTIAAGSTGNKSYKANWEANTYTITYKPNGGSGSDQTQTVTYGTAWTTKGAIYSRTGYTMSSWNTQANGSGTKYTPNLGQTDKQLSNVTLYAQWTPNTYTITSKYFYYYQNNTWKQFDTKTEQRTYGSSFAPHNVNSPTGYHAGNNYGYYTEKNEYLGGGTVGTNNITVNQNIIVHVHYYPNTYTITYKPNGGSGTDQTQTATYGISWTSKDAIYSRTGYTQTSWNTQANGSGTKYSLNMGQTAEQLNNVTLYAQWTPNSYYLDLNGYLDGVGSGSISGYGTADIYVNGKLVADDVSDYCSQILYGSTYEIKDIKTKAGHVYNGVHSGKLSGTIGVDRVNVYLSFSTKVITTAFHRNIGDSDTTTTTQNFKYGQSGQTFNANTWSRTGYTFIGWSTNKNATSMTYPDKCGVADSWIDSNYPSINLYAVWSLNTYSINYNLNGGSISGQKTSYNVNTDTFTLPIPTKTGYTFIGWTGSNGTTPQKSVSISKGSTGNKSYTANWSINSYTLTVNPNGGLWNGSSSSQNIAQNYNTTKSIQVPTRTGYTFLRWDLKGSGTLNNRITSDPYFTSGIGGISTYNNNGDGKVALTRQTKSSDNTFGSNYEIKIDVKGANNPGYGGFYHGITSVANTKYVHSFIAKLPKGTTLAIAHNPVGDDYSKRWLTSNVGTGAWQVYAYEMNTGSKGTFSTFGHVYVSSSTTSAFTWYLAASQITTVSSNATYTYGAGNGTLVAQWTPNRYTVTYNPNKGSGSMSPDTVTYGTAYKTKKNTFTRTGYTFNGWNEKADSTGTAWSLSSSGVYEANKTWTWTYTHDITLYAQWKPNNYTYNIKYVSSSGKQLGSDTVTGAFDTSKTVTPPAKTGYTTPVAQTVKFDSTSAKTITFTYQLINYSISYDVNGGAALSGQRTSYNIESSAYTLPTPSKTGHTFTGWTGSNGTAPQKSVTIAAGSTGNKSYKANWTINSYTNSISHWAGGFKNQEGNNSSKSWFALRTTTFNKNYGETFSMNDSLATAIPNGFYLIGKFGTSSLEGTWKTYEKPYSITQPAKDMSFEYDYYPYDYSIAYNLDSGTNNSANPSKYNVLYGVSLKNPTKTGYTFLGWYDNVNLIINKKYEIANDTTVNGNNYVFKNTTNGNTLNVFQIQTWKDETYLETFAGGSQTGTRQEKYTHNRDTGNYTIRLKANGSTKDSSVYYYDVYLEKGKTYSISYNIEKCTSSEVVVKNLSFTRSDKVTGINEGANATFTSSDELYAKLKNRQTGNINLTAKWTPNEYTLTLNPNGGNIKGNTNAQSLNPSLYYDRGNWWYVGSMSPSRAGYSFSGWFDAPSGGIKIYDSEGNCTNDGKYWKNKQYKYLGNLTVYAQWTPNSYTYNIKYVSSSNKSLGSDTVTGIFDTSKTVTPPDKTGYTTPAAQTVKFDSTSAKTITFIYQLINYSISYDVNRGTALSGQRTSYNIESSAYTLPVPSRIGYTFTGWTGSNGTTPQKSVTIAAGSTGNKSYKANWTANSLTIRYHSNGAFGGNKFENNSWTNNAILDYEQSRDIVIRTEIAKEGYANDNLKQWGVTNYSAKRENSLYLYKNGYLGTSKYNTKQDGSGIEIDENKTFNSVIELANYLGKPINSNDNSIDLYPQWKAINYSIAYNGNGATAGSMTEQSATFDKNVELTSNTFSRKYTVTYNATGGTVNAPNNVASATFKGWEDRGNITFMDKNYAYNDFDAPYYSQNYTDLNAAFGFNKYNLVKHYFLYGKSEGRNTKDKAGNAGLYPNKATVKNMTITNGYKVNLYANWKLGSVTLPTPTRFGYKFIGWYTSAEGGTKITGATYTPTSNVTLYAHWKLDSYYIDYNVNDTGLTDRIVDNLPDNNGSLPGKETAVMLTDFALQNGSKYNTKYTFKEWNTKPDGSGKKFTTSITNDGSLCKPGETLTLYAQWNTTPTITGKDFYILENMKPASDILTSGKGLDKNPIDHFPDNMKDVAYPVKGYTKNGTDISSRIKVDYVEFDNSKTATASIDTKKPGKYTVHYSLTDGKQTKKFTRTITVLSASTPVINAGDRYFNKGSFVTAEMLLSTVTSGDRYDGDLTTKVAVLNMEQITFNTVGSYELQYKVTNRSGKAVVKKVKVHILEYLTDNQADKDNKYRYIRKDCSTKNDYCMEYFKEDSKWVTNDELNNQIIDSLSKDKSEEAIKKYHFSQDDVERSKQ